MPRKNDGKRSMIFAVFLVGIVIASLFVLPQVILPSSASPSVPYSVSASPARIQEGLNTNITVNLKGATASTTYPLKVNVTTPAVVSYSANVTVVTNATGVGSNLTEFWNDFVSASATNFVGFYNVTLLNEFGNETLATANFTVGLTDKVKYLRQETVNIRGSGYNANETVSVDLKLGNVSVSGFPKPVNASAEGVIVDSWVVPAGASFGVYTLTLSNTTAAGTVKPGPDVQLFTVEGTCDVQTRNLADQPVTGVTVEVYNATSGQSMNLPSQTTNGTGWVQFTLGVGDYTFKAFWKNKEVGAENLTFTENRTLQMMINLSNFKLTVTDDVGDPMPLISLDLNYNYTKRGMLVATSEEVSFVTDVTGTVQLENVFTNISYFITASRYGLVFNTTFIQSLPEQPWSNITIIVPKYNVSVQLQDAQGASSSGIEVGAYEWTSGTSQPVQTQTSVGGKVTFSLLFGKYLLRASAGSSTLNETELDLIENKLNFTFQLAIFNLNVPVRVVDYFGQPIANANVAIERRIGQEYKLAYSQVTGADGSTTFASIVGGDSRVLVYIGGRLAAATTTFLKTDSSQVTISAGEYVAILGYPIESGLFALFCFIIVLVVAFLIMSRNLLMKAFRRKG